jgi:hypothetical protein
MASYTLANLLHGALIDLYRAGLRVALGVVASHVSDVTCSLVLGRCCVCLSGFERWWLGILPCAMQYVMKDYGTPPLLGHRSRDMCGLEAFEAALSIRRDVLLPPHPDLARTYGYLGVRIKAEWRLGSTARRAHRWY